MALIPAGTRFEGIPSSTKIDLRSEQINESLTVYTIDDISESVKPYKVYTALLSQSGTDDPVATVLENNIDQTLVWERLSIGQYRLSLPGSPTSGPFIVGKTFAFTGNGLNSAVQLGFNNSSSMGMPNDIGMVLRNYDSSLNPTDVLNNASIEVRIYN